MPSRNSALISVLYDDREPAFKMYLDAFGHPDQVRDMVKRACKARRRQIMVNPDIFPFNLAYAASLKTTVYPSKRERDYCFTYYINLHAAVPRVKIYDARAHHNRHLHFFDWIGPEYRTKPKPVVQNPAADYSGKRRRGRPTNVSKAIGRHAPESAPENIVVDEAKRTRTIYWKDGRVSTESY